MDSKKGDYNPQKTIWSEIDFICISKRIEAINNQILEVLLKYEYQLNYDSLKKPIKKSNERKDIN
jgi:hypothetical protein